jgi:hypothetical protein
MLAELSVGTLKRLDVKGVLSDLWALAKFQRAKVHTVWGLVDQIAGASFILAGSLHAAILAQAYGVPWAAYFDGYVDAPPKWLDWGDYLGIKINFVRDLEEGREWWAEVGRHGRVRDLVPLVKAFPYLKASKRAMRFIAHLESSRTGAYQERLD